MSTALNGPQWSPLLGSGMTCQRAHAACPHRLAAMEPAPWERDDAAVGGGDVGKAAAAMEPAPWERDDVLKAHQALLAAQAAMEPAPWERDDTMYPSQQWPWPRCRNGARSLGAG